MGSIRIPTWFKNFVRRKPVKLLGSVNIHIYAVIEALGWLTYSVALTNKMGLLWSTAGMIVLGMMFHAVLYAGEAVAVREDHNIYDGNGRLSKRDKIKEFIKAIVHNPTIPDAHWQSEIDLRIWYPAVYRFVWFGLSLCYVMYNFFKNNYGIL